MLRDIPYVKHLILKMSTIATCSVLSNLSTTLQVSGTLPIQTLIKRVYEYFDRFAACFYWLKQADGLEGGEEMFLNKAIFYEFP